MASSDEGSRPWTLGGLFRRHLLAYLAGASCLLASATALNRVDWLSKAAIDSAFGGDGGRAIRTSVAMVALTFLAFLAATSSRYFVFNAVAGVEYDLRRSILAKLHQPGGSLHRRMSAGELMSRMTNDVVGVRATFGFGAFQAFNAAFAFASSLQVMFGVSWRMTLAASVTMPFVVVTMRYFSRHLLNFTRANQERLGQLASLVEGSLTGMRVIRSFALEDRELERFALKNDGYFQANLSLARVRAFLGPTLGLASAASILAFFWYGGILLCRPASAPGAITKGDFFAFNLALMRMTWPLMAVGSLYSVIQRGRACFGRIKEIFDDVPEIRDSGVGVPNGVGLEVEGLSFSYVDREVLHDVSFQVPPGRSLAIVGRTGSGKSTLAQLLVRMLPTPAGTVRLGGMDVCDMPIRELRQRLGYAQQSAFLFSTTVSRNVGFSMDDPDSPQSMTQIRDAMGAAQVLREALELPDALDTVVGERGIQLSGGQRQRVALARALAWGPPILLLDDPLSAVDSKTETAILEGLRRKLKGHSFLLVTHRVAAAATCDEIAVLDAGRIVARGTHDALISEGGLYAAFAKQQQLEGETAEVER